MVVLYSVKRARCLISIGDIDCTSSLVDGTNIILKECYRFFDLV